MDVAYLSGKIPFQQWEIRFQHESRFRSSHESNMTIKIAFWVPCFVHSFVVSRKCNDWIHDLIYFIDNSCGATLRQCDQPIQCFTSERIQLATKINGYLKIDLDVSAKTIYGNKLEWNLLELCILLIWIHKNWCIFWKNRMDVIILSKDYISHKSASCWFRGSCWFSHQSLTEVSLKTEEFQSKCRCY